MSSRPWSKEQHSTTAGFSAILHRAMLVPSQALRTQPWKRKDAGHEEAPSIHTHWTEGWPSICFPSPRPRGAGLYGCLSGACEKSWRCHSQLFRAKRQPPFSSPLLHSKPAAASPSSSGLLLLEGCLYPALAARQLLCWD